MSTNLIQAVKENDQDFEFYPTTDEIIEVFKNDLLSVYEEDIRKDTMSLLDIGAGNGKVLKAFGNFKRNTKYENIKKIYVKKYAIEKSKILIDSLDKDIILIGTDFYEQTLIDKKVDIIFCNPPYSEFVYWMEKIIKESNSSFIYFVVPERWKNKSNIKDALKLRDFDYKVIGSFDFEDAEDRKARAKVNLIRITHSVIKHGDRFYNTVGVDPFDLWFDETFKFSADVRINKYSNEEKAKPVNSIISKKNLIHELETLYTSDMEQYIKNYHLLSQMDITLFKELDLSVNGLKEGLKLKIENLKLIYWRKLFDNLDAITNRLTSKSREKLLSKLNDNVNIDFTASNVYAVIIWTIKNANEYFDKQLLEVYEDLANKENIIKYKSNKKIVEDSWRYVQEMTHYTLDYRIVKSKYSAIYVGGYDSYRYVNKLNESCHELIGDIITIAQNLGFNIITDSKELEWSAGKSNNFYCRDESIFMDVKAFKNGNLHFRLKPEFMKKFNIEASRLNGWVKSPKEASQEFDITEQEAKEMYNTNLQIHKNSMLLLENNL